MEPKSIEITSQPYVLHGNSTRSYGLIQIFQVLI